MNSAPSEHSGVTPLRLTLTMKGPKVGDARLSAADLAEIIKGTQRALRRVARVLYGEESQRQGRDKADIMQLCEIFLVAWKAGSAVAQLELATPPPQMQLFGNIGEESVSAFLAGMSTMQNTSASATSLPHGFDRGVLQTCHDLAKVLDHGIDTITFGSQNRDPLEQFTLDIALRNRLRELLGKPDELSVITKTGRLEELNGHGALKGQLWEADGTKWVCHFNEKHTEQLSHAWMRTVRVVGRAIVEKRNELEVESLVVLEDEMASPAARETSPFWKSLSLNELAEQQAVAAVSDLDEISSFWPVDDDPDELLQHVLREREFRRALGDGGSAT